MDQLDCDVLVVGGGTGGTAAAIQAARRGARTILVSEFPWLGGMLTSAGVAAPDGNELAAFQTGIWGAFLRELRQRQPGGLDHSWVSCFTYDPRMGAQIFADWAAALPNLQWIRGQVPLEVLRQGDRVTGVRFADLTVTAPITLDGTELGDLLALGSVPYHWGWEWQAEWGEPSAPIGPNTLTHCYPVQAPTWVVILQDFSPQASAPAIPAPPGYDPAPFTQAWERYGPEKFLNYGRLPGDLFMINWPIHGNDYGEGADRLIGSLEERQQFHQEARWHSQGFAHFIQSQLGRRYGLAESVFPAIGLGGGGYALHPYYRESRRLQGLVTLTEPDLLPVEGGQVAALPGDAQGQVTAIALGNYPNDHHYPSGEIPLKPKSTRWGGRWTGTPFTIPYPCLVPATVDGLLVCEKNISVSHMANGSTRLQPLVLGIGQAAGMAAALCVEQNCQPRDLPVRSLQQALLQDPSAPAAIVPLFNLVPGHPEWQYWQEIYLDRPEAYPVNGYCPLTSPPTAGVSLAPTGQTYQGQFRRQGEQHYALELTDPENDQPLTLQLITLWPEVNQQLQTCPEGPVVVQGVINRSGQWLMVRAIDQA